MHLSLEGSLKFMLDLYLNPNNHTSNFYLRNSITHMEQLLARIKFTSSFSRTQRSLYYYNTFKASEYRNLAFYSLIYILKGTMPENYYEHMLQYLLFLRILNKDKITDNEIDFAQKLINEFILKYEALYGTVNLKYNLHAHLHLPKMVADLGSLYKYAGFSGEGAFHVFQRYFHGTINICTQIVSKLNLIIENDNFLTIEEISKINKQQFREYAENIYAKKNQTPEARETFNFKKQALVHLEDMDVAERNLFFAKNLCNNSPMETSNKIKFKNKCKYLPYYLFPNFSSSNCVNFLDYTVCDEKTTKKKTQNYTICYSENNLRIYGLIRKIYKINESFFF
jgi:hypothetical protein